MHSTATARSNLIWIASQRMSNLSKAHVGLVFAWAAVFIYAASNSIVSLLVSIGEATPVAEGRNAITYTNLLLLGSLISVVPIAVVFRRDLTVANVRRLTTRNWGLLTLSAFLSSALTPGLFFYALANTSVTNVVLISRIEPPLFLLAAWLVLNENFSRRAMSAALVALSGAVVMVSLREGGGLGTLGTGEWATVAATSSYIASTLVSRTGLRDIPMGLFSVVRTILGAAIYFALICMIFGADTFRDILAPVLWSWIWLYAGIVIVLGQMAWNMALKHARSESLSLATSFSPLVAIVIAVALLGEAPGPGFLPGAALTLLAILLSRKSATAQTAAAKATARTPEPVRSQPQTLTALGLAASQLTGFAARDLQQVRPAPHRTKRASVRPVAPPGSPTLAPRFKQPPPCPSHSLRTLPPTYLNTAIFNRWHHRKADVIVA